MREPTDTTDRKQLPEALRKSLEETACGNTDLLALVTGLLRDEKHDDGATARIQIPCQLYVDMRSVADLGRFLLQMSEFEPTIIPTTAIGIGREGCLYIGWDKETAGVVDCSYTDFDENGKALN